MNAIDVIKEKGFYKLYTPSSESEIVCAEEKLEVCFAEDYKNLLRLSGFVIYDHHELAGICKDSRLNVVSLTLQEKKNVPNVPKNWYAIEKLDIDGIIVWQCETGEIFVSMPNSQFLKKDNSLAEYIQHSS